MERPVAVAAPAPVPAQMPAPQPQEEQRTGLEPGCELDLCFICDCTGSMSSYIQAAQANITTIVDRISSQHDAGVRFGLISYRDHPPQDRTYVTKCFPFTESKSTMSEYVNTMTANGGGDGPEAVTAGLFQALHLPWRPNATKICILIADAPPHGLEPQGDGFPNGDPDGHDPLEIAREMVVHGITVYTVGCEPALGCYRFARDFFCTIAEITSGQAVALSSASLLADVIIHGSAEELSLAKLQKQVEEEIFKVQADARENGTSLTSADAVDRAHANLQAFGMTSVQVETDGHMKNASAGHWGGVAACERKSLATVKADLVSAFGCAVEPQTSLFGSFSTGGDASAFSFGAFAAPPSKGTFGDSSLSPSPFRLHADTYASTSAGLFGDAMRGSGDASAGGLFGSSGHASGAGLFGGGGGGYSLFGSPAASPSKDASGGLFGRGSGSFDTSMSGSRADEGRAKPACAAPAHSGFGGASMFGSSTAPISKEQVARIMQKAQYQDRLL